ncbi:MAG: hypothetical protein LBJ11_10670 [Oscillospiraceae bacterium]|jgi:hypothetical protein|nr:hypothetical protein [Oscillospiraceae bacterium]
MKLKHIGQHILRRISKAHLIGLGAVVVLGVFILIMGTTSSWLFSNDTTENGLGMQPAQYNVYLKEKFTAPAAAKAGDVVSKETWVTNQGTLPAFVRVKVFPTLVAPDGVTYLPANISDQLTFDGTLNMTNWRFCNDGYYYYLGAVAAGASTPKLFERVALSGTIGSEYPNAKLTVTLLCESVQTSGFAYRSAWWNGNAATPPAENSLLAVDNILKDLIQ